MSVVGKTPPPRGAAGQSIRSADRGPQHIFNVLCPGAQHNQAIKAERDAGRGRQSGFECRKEILVDRVNLTVKRLFLRLVGDKAGALLGGVGQLAKGVGEFETADIELEALGKARVGWVAP